MNLDSFSLYINVSSELFHWKHCYDLSKAGNRQFFAGYLTAREATWTGSLRLDLFCFDWEVESSWKIGVGVSVSSCFVVCRCIYHNWRVWVLLDVISFKQNLWYKIYLQNIFVYRKGDIVKDPLKFISFVPKTIPGSRRCFPEPPQLPFGRLSPLEAMHFHLAKVLQPV